MKFLKIDKLQRYLLFIFIICIITALNNKLMAQNDNPYVRIARIIVDSSQLENYKAALKEGTSAAVEKEPGVISLYAVYDEKNPTYVTVFEIYKDKAAYETHIQTAHFKKYKTTVEKMVKSLELTDVIPISLATKQHN